MATRVTMQQVAESAGVSRSTVSLALRNHPGIPEETRARVRAAAGRVGYRPNPLVATLMAQLHGKRRAADPPTLALLDFTTREDLLAANPLRQFAEGLHARAGELGFRVETFPCAAPDMTAAHLEKILHARGIAGVLVPPAVDGNDRIDLEWSGYAVAGFATRLGEPAMDRVGADHYGNALMAAERLTQLGYVRIGLVLPKKMSGWVQDKWLAGFLVFQGRLPASRRLALHMPEQNRLDPQAFAQWYRQERPDAILFQGHNMRACVAALDLRVPADLALATLNAWPDAHFGGVDENGAAIGAAAVNLVVARLHRNERGLPEVPTSVLVQGSWQMGETVARKDRGG